jgi:hypothetical protein
VYNFFSFVCALPNLVYEQLAQGSELLGSQDDCESAHALRCPLPYVDRGAVSKLLVNGLHQRVLVDYALLSQNDQTVAFEQVSADVQTFLLASVFFRLLNPLEQRWVERLDNALSAFLQAVVDDSSDA